MINAYRNMNGFFSTSLSEKEFSCLSMYIKKQCGIILPPMKKTTLEARLCKRIKTIKLNTFIGYYDLLFTANCMDTELINMIDVVTTNKTSIFREPGQFEFLFEKALPELLSNKTGLKRNLKIWSAVVQPARPYTLSIVAKEFAGCNHKYTYSILGTDISTRVLYKAASGVYEKEKVEPVPVELLKKYFLRSTVKK